MNKLAMNALTAPDRTAYQQWLIDLAVELVDKHGGLMSERDVFLRIGTIAANGDLPVEVTPTINGIGTLEKALTAICWHIREGGRV